jgi:hypothetical protein
LNGIPNPPHACEASPRFGTKDSRKKRSPFVLG